MKDYTYIEEEINKILEGVLFGENRLFDISKDDLVIEVKSCKEYFKTGKKFNRGKIVINLDTHIHNIENYGDKFKYIIAIKDEEDKLIYFMIIPSKEIDRILQNKNVYESTRGLNIIYVYHNEIIDIEYIKYINKNSDLHKI